MSDVKTKACALLVDLVWILKLAKKLKEVLHIRHFNTQTCIIEYKMKTFLNLCVLPLGINCLGTDSYNTFGCELLRVTE
jgi:hypothetical protein